MKIGYVRTSKKDQNPELELRDLLAFGCERVFEEQISSRKENRPELRAAMDYCREGDEFVFMDSDTYEQVHVPAGTVGDGAGFVADFVAAALP